MFRARQHLRWIVVLVVIVLFFLTVENIVAEKWNVISQLPTHREGFSVAVVNDKIYLIGGTPFENRNGPFGMSLVEVYDPQTNRWYRVSDMPTPRANAKAAVVDGKIYVLSGHDGIDRRIVNNEPLKVVEVYDPKTDTWMRKQDMLTVRGQFGISTVAGRIYAIGGSNFLEDLWRFRFVESYDPETDTWMKRAKMPTIRDRVRTGVVNSDIYVIGGAGWPPGANGGPHLSTIEVYHPKTNKWAKRPNMPNLKIGFSTVVVKDKIYLIGGFLWLAQVVVYLSTVDIYDPEAEEWSHIPLMPMPMAPFGAAAVNGKIYVFGGTGENRELFTDVLVFDTGFRAVKADGKLSIRWGELKTQHLTQP